jgi:hypothetical protein
MDNAKEFRSQ